MQNQHSSNTSRAVVSLIAILAITLIAVLLSAAMQAGGWMFLGLIVGLVALCATGYVCVWLLACKSLMAFSYADDMIAISPPAAMPSIA